MENGLLKQPLEFLLRYCQQYISNKVEWHDLTILQIRESKPKNDREGLVRCEFSLLPLEWTFELFTRITIARHLTRIYIVRFLLLYRHYAGSCQKREVVNRQVEDERCMRNWGDLLDVFRQTPDERLCVILMLNSCNQGLKRKLESADAKEEAAVRRLELRLGSLRSLAADDEPQSKSGGLTAEAAFRRQWGKQRVDRYARSL